MSDTMREKIRKILLTVWPLNYDGALTEIMAVVDEKVKLLDECREFIGKHHSNHRDCEEGYYYRPKDDSYNEIPSGKIPCYCGWEEARQLLERLK